MSETQSPARDCPECGAPVDNYGRCTKCNVGWTKPGLEDLTKPAKIYRGRKPHAK